MIYKESVNQKKKWYQKHEKVVASDSIYACYSSCI